MEKQIHYRVRIKECGKAHWIESDYIGNLSRHGVIKFYGLNEPDVENYKIEVVKDKEG